VNEATEAVAILLVLTPDDGPPPELAKLNDVRVVWTSFSIPDRAKTTLDLDEGRSNAAEDGVPQRTRRCTEEDGGGIGYRLFRAIRKKRGVNFSAGRSDITYGFVALAFCSLCSSVSSVVNVRS
jgi:hypothetical protein